MEAPNEAGAELRNVVRYELWQGQRFDRKMPKGYVPTPEVLGERERNRQLRVITNAGLSIRPDFWLARAPEHGPDAVQVGFADNRDREEYRRSALAIATACAQAGLPVSVRLSGPNAYLKFNRAAVEYAVSLHAEYRAALEKPDATAQR